MDKPIVRSVSESLARAGIPVWFDEQQIFPGDDIIARISDGLARSMLILVFLSKHFCKSRWVTAEWAPLFHQQLTGGATKVIPVLIGDLPEPLPAPILMLRSKQYVDLRDLSDSSRLDSFIRFLRSRIPIAENAEARSGRELTARGRSLADGSISVTYELQGEATLSTRIDADGMAALQSAASSDLHRVAFRFGRKSTAGIEEIARRVSTFLLPPQVRAWLRNGGVERFRILVDVDDPQLPWELGHDGDYFLGTRLRLISSPLLYPRETRDAFVPKSIRIVEG
jgi:hypothetical protein